jgi:trans-2,3-dihydro-3-hydroxyanthranilate isomerase
LTTRRAVDSAVFDADAYNAFRRAAGLEDLPIFLFSSEAGSDNGTVYSRMFGAAVGVPEDPATGGACGALGGYLVKNKVVTPDKAGAMLIVQGVKMGRPSCIHIAIGADGGEITSVRVGGESVLAGEGTLYV